jgi:hypothetical protein
METKLKNVSRANMPPNKTKHREGEVRSARESEVARKKRRKETYLDDRIIN